LLERLGGDEALLREILELMRDGIPRRLDEMQTALNDENCTGLYRAAHSLKGSLGYLEAAPATAAVERMETIAVEKDLRTAREFYPELQRRLEQVAALVEELALAT